MQPFCIVHEYQGTPGDFWALVLDDDHNRAFFAAVGLDYAVESETVEGARLLRTVAYRSRTPVSALMRPFFPDGFGYREHSVFDLEGRRCEFRIEPGPFAKRATIHATLSLEALGSDRTRRTYAGTVAIDVPLLGRRLETETIRAMHKSHATAAHVTRAWLAQRLDATSGGRAAE